MATPLELFVDALHEIGVLDLVSTAPSAEALEVCKRVYNAIVSTMQLNGSALPVTHIQSFSIGSSAVSYTIGPTGTFVTTSLGARPVELEAVKMVLTAQSPYTEILMRPLTAEEYQRLAVPGLSMGESYAYWYNPTMPDGTFYPLPYPTVTTNQFKFFYKAPLAAVTTDTLSTDISYAPGQQDFLHWQLAQRLCGPFRTDLSAAQRTLASVAFEQYESSNMRDPSFVYQCGPGLTDDQALKGGPYVW